MASDTAPELALRASNIAIAPTCEFLNLRLECRWGNPSHRKLWFIRRREIHHLSAKI